MLQIFKDSLLIIVNPSSYNLSLQEFRNFDVFKFFFLNPLSISREKKQLGIKTWNYPSSN